MKFSFNKLNSYSIYFSSLSVFKSVCKFLYGYVVAIHDQNANNYINYFKKEQFIVGCVYAISEFKNIYFLFCIRKL